MQHLITDARGKPLRNLTDLWLACRLSASLTACVRQLCAVWPSMDQTTKEIAAVSGHLSLSEIERYTAKADQAGLADSAIGKLPDAENR